MTRASGPPLSMSTKKEVESSGHRPAGHRQFRGRTLPGAPRRGRLQQLVELETPFGVTLKGQYKIRAALQGVLFVSLLVGFGLVNLYYGGGIGDDSHGASAAHSTAEGRFLEESSGGASGSTDSYNPSIPDCEGLPKADPGWLAAFYTIGVLYMFLAIAICCDEFFVPALEEMASERRMNMSMDVAGATLMAAGGSAPELFTSLVGTFRQSDIGFGTIIGSATFNILFVISMCCLLTKDVLPLTWWPLFRDCACYTVGLVLLAVFCGVVTPGEVHLWEAIILFVVYLGYCVIMWQNENIYKAITGKDLVYAGEELKVGKGTDATEQDAKEEDHWHGTFRAGVLKLLRDPHSWLETAGLGLVARIAGDANNAFQHADADGNGHVDREELKQLFHSLECDISDAELDEVFGQLDTDHDGKICQKEFTEWYLASEERIMSQMRHVFDKIDVDQSNTIDKEELKTLLSMLDPSISDKDVQSALDTMYKHGSREEITFEEFSDWYTHSMIFERQKQAIEEDIPEGYWDNLLPPKEGSYSARAWYICIFPLILVMTLTIPNVLRPGMRKWCYVSFTISIAWIALFAYLMVDWAEIVAYTLGIPSVLIGLTVLAAGTSVPDLLNSIIVARRGEGDMALSSSVGSNIFDLNVGLGLPWVLYTLWPSTPSVVYMNSDGLFRSVLMLLGMLVVTIALVHWQGWKLTNLVGWIFFFLYIAFLVAVVLFELPFVICNS